MLKSARHLFQKRARSYPQAKMCKLFLIFTYQRVIAPKTFFHIAVTIKSVVSDYKKSKKGDFFSFFSSDERLSLLVFLSHKKAQRCWVFYDFLQTARPVFLFKVIKLFSSLKKTWPAVAKTHSKNMTNWR